MASSPQYVGTPKIGQVAIATANAARDGSGTMGIVATGAATGSRIDRLSLNAIAATTAGMLRLFVSSTTAANDATNTHQVLEIPVSAITPGASVAAFNKNLSSATHPDLFPIILPSGYTLRAATNNAEAFRVTAQLGDFS